MSETVELHASDGHALDAYVAKPDGAPIGGLVVIQEIFGVNKHIRSVADGYAKDGFFVVAPALFDRVEKHVELGYEGAEGQQGYALMQKLNIDNALLDVDAALAYAKKESGGKAGVVGYCFGGLLAWLSSTRLHPAAAVGYYAGGIGNVAGETPKAPIILHFGKNDEHIPREQVEKVIHAHPEQQIYWYDAGHGFNCDMRSSFDGPSAKLARERSLAFLKQHIAGA
jgi:carboxymethylenebutenolidase